MTRRQAPEDFLWSTSTPNGAPRLPAFAGAAVAWVDDWEQEAKFFNDFSRARACACAQGGVHSESPVCEPECPVNAIKADSEPGLEKWLSLNAEYAKIWPNITVKKAPPPDWKEWEGKPDKLQYFSPKPGTGD
jgi:Domain of unknown function (DUF3470)